MTLEVAAAAIVRHGRVLAARRTHPADVAGGWELPGGKVDSGESVDDAVRREIREELACDVEVVRPLAGRAPIKPGYELTAHLARLVDGEPIPHEHDAVRWLMPEEFDEVDWLPSDRPFLLELRQLLLDGDPLLGGNVGGAVRVGATVRRATGPWTPAVHALLAHLAAAGIGETPRVLGTDELGREVLTYLPGRVVDVDTEGLPVDVLARGMGWLARYHAAVAGFRSEGPWRTGATALGPGQLVCHHDFAPYNVALSGSAEGEVLVGVFDWDVAGPGVPLDDLAFAAWNWVPLYRDIGPELSARRLEAIAAAYDGGLSARQILEAVDARIERSVSVIAAGQEAGDPGMLNLANAGEPARTAQRLESLRGRIPSILALLSP